jgi:preprotein translocase subunit Sss1
MKQLLKESHENFVELMKTVVVINSKFDQYNNFNERLAEFQTLLSKQDKQMDELRSKVSFINARLGWIVGGIGFVVTVGFNLLASFVSSLWKG